MKRREFIAGVGGAAVLPLAARAQQGNLKTAKALGGMTAAATWAVIELKKPRR